MPKRLAFVIINVIRYGGDMTKYLSFCYFSIIHICIHHVYIRKLSITNNIGTKNMFVFSFENLFYGNINDWENPTLVFSYFEFVAKSSNMWYPISFCNIGEKLCLYNKTLSQNGTNIHNKKIGRILRILNLNMKLNGSYKSHRKTKRCVYHMYLLQGITNWY